MHAVRKVRYTKDMKVYIASDHAGFAYKKVVASAVQELGHEPVDMGPVAFDPQDDYPVFIRPAADAVAADVQAGVDSCAIILGGSGQGEAIVANRVPRVRAIVYYGGSQDIVKLGREHGDANVLSLGARFLSESEVREAVKLWLTTPFSEAPRHIRRLQMIDRPPSEFKS